MKKNLAILGLLGLALLGFASYSYWVNSTKTNHHVHNNETAHEEDKHEESHPQHNHTHHQHKAESVNLNEDAVDFIINKIASNTPQGLINARFSEDGTKIFATSDHNLGIYILDATNLKLVNSFLVDELIGSYATWHYDNQSIIFRRKNKEYHFETFIYNTNTNELKQVNIPHNYLTCIGFDGDTTNVVYLNKKMDIEHKKSNGEISLIASNPKKYYHLIRNKNAEIMVAHTGNNIELINLQTKETKVIDSGLANSISPDNTKIFYHKDFEGEHHQIGSSELFVYDIVTQTKTQLTQTKNMIELFPTLSPDGSKILFCEEKSNQLVVGTINF